MATERETALTVSAMNDRLRVPHSPQAGDSSSFHLPLHWDLAMSVRTLCSVVVPDGARGWWKLQVIDDDFTEVSLQSVAVS
jgi:hypothetical protein